MTATRQFPPSAPPSMGALRALGHPPRVHPNGFIQLDLDERRRLHVWHPGLSVRQRTYHPIHDHVFDFLSLVYTGRLINAAYDVVEDPARGTHMKWQVRHLEGEDSVLAPRVDLGRHSLKMGIVRVLQPGEGYEFPAFMFHEIAFNEPTMTIICKSAPTVQQGSDLSPTVIVPVGVEPDNDFRREVHDLADLWTLIGEAHPDA